MPGIERFIARRYLTSKRKVRFINVIAYISVAGITVGVAALLVALSVFNGFNSVVTAVLVGFDPHLRIEMKGSMSASDFGLVQKVLDGTTDVKAYSPFVSGKAMLSTRVFSKVVFVRGVDEDRITEVSGLKEKMIFGSLSLHDSGGIPGIVLGLALADKLEALLGEDIVVYSPSGIQNVLMGIGVPLSLKCRVVGIFDSNNKDYDANYAYVGLLSAQRLFNCEEKYNGVEMRLTDVSRAQEIKEEFSKQLPPEFLISTWYDLHQSLYSVMKIERWSAYLLLSMIIVVASFNMLGSLTMGVIEKRRDIAILKSMGMNSSRVIRVFMLEGMLIGVIGTILGMMLGLLVLFLQVHYRIIPLDPTVYIIPAIPVEIRLADFISIAVASLGLSFLAAYYPARRASSTSPADALRWE